MSKRLLFLVPALIAPACSDDGGPVLDLATVAVTRGGVPVAGATVVFHTPDGTVAAIAQTDAQGRTGAEIEAGSMVTVVDTAVSFPRLFTVTGVSPGLAPIEVPLESPPDGDPPPAVATLRIGAPNDPPPAGTDSFAVETGCGMFPVPSLPATIPISAGCITDAGTVPVIVTAWEPPGDLEHPGSPLATLTGLAIAGPGGTEYGVDPTAWSTDCDQVDITTDPVMSVTLWPRYGGFNFLRSRPVCEPQPPATGYAYPVFDFGEGLTVSTFGYVTGSLRMAFSKTSYATTPSTLEISSATDLLIGDLDLIEMDGHGARWTTDPALADADVIIAKLSWSLPDQSYLQWTFVVGGDATAVVRPELPDDIETWPGLGMATDHVAELRALDAPWLAPNLDAIDHALPELLELEPRISRQPAGSSLREYREQFYPDAPN